MSIGMSFRALIVLAAAMLAACSSSYVLVGTARPRISPDQVKLYLHPPAKYEEIALLDSASGWWAFTAQGKSDTVIARLKKEAAKLGANGILLEGVGDQQSGTVNGGGMGSLGRGIIGGGGSATRYRKSGNGLAIYVDPGVASN